ncbi:XdhC family protein [Croceiramulus getboli]|nr:XdhC family protein [Flavobacteriaceae bacterium YJPT1-3]
MTHEFKTLVETALDWQQQQKRLVLATVVHVEGHSYRRPGVRMLISDQGEWVGAVSGGCVEKEVYRQALQVLESQSPKVMSYDGRLRLGCEGIIYLLLEPLEINSAFAKAFHQALSSRTTMRIESFYEINSLSNPKETRMGSQLLIEEHVYPFSTHSANLATDLECFAMTLPPLFQLYLIGAEHDAVALCKIAAALGWQVQVVASPDEQKSIEYFPGAARLLTPAIDQLDTKAIDQQTAVVLMTHSFNKDVQYLMQLRHTEPAYFGLLGPRHRRERLFEELLERYPETEPEFLERLHGPAGINIGAENAAEIAISVLAEILSVLRDQQPVPLREKTGSIHE